jgi:hypothetical protein
MSTSELLFIFKTLESNTSIDPDWRILEKYLYVYKQALDFSLVLAGLGKPAFEQLGPEL